MLYNDIGLSDTAVQHLAFGVSTGDICYLIQRYWTRVLNPNCLTPVEMAQHVGDSLPQAEQDRFAKIAEQAYMQGENEASVVLEALRIYLLEQGVFGSRRKSRLKNIDRRFKQFLPAANKFESDHVRH